MARKKSYWTSPGFLVAAVVGSAALYYVYAHRPRTRVVATIGPAVLDRSTVTIGPAVIDGYGAATR